MRPDDEKKEIKTQADVVVVGAGGSGLAAAVTAAEKGARVIVLEVRNVPGGNSALAGGLFTTRAPGMDKEKVPAVSDDYFKQQMRWSHWRTNPRLVRALIDKSGDVIEWLEKRGVEFKPDLTVPGHPMYRIVGPGRGGTHAMKALVHKCEDLGVQVLYGTRGRQLITDKQQITGVLAEALDKKLTIDAASVVLASGGFAGNREKLKVFFPSFNEPDEMYLQGLPHQGDGQTMAAEVGAAADGLVLLEISGLIFPWAERLAILARHHNTLWVNKRGERFIDESVGFPYFTNAIFRQPAKVFYVLFDEKIKEDILKKNISPAEAANIAPGSWPSQVEKDLEAQAAQGRTKKAESWEEIAVWMEADPSALKLTINEYNGACDNGRDSTFAKGREDLQPLRTPPFYAVKCCVSLLVTHGDIRINHKMEVLNRQGNPIQGLYAAGDDTGDVDAGAYNIGLPGHSFGFAINSGRIAGENAAAFLTEKDRL